MSLTWKEEAEHICSLKLGHSATLDMLIVECGNHDYSYGLLVNEIKVLKERLDQEALKEKLLHVQTLSIRLRTEVREVLKTFDGHGEVEAVPDMFYRRFKAMFMDRWNSRPERFVCDSILRYIHQQGPHKIHHLSFQKIRSLSKYSGFEFAMDNQRMPSQC